MEHSLGYNLGMLVGVLAGALVGVGIIALLFKLKVMDLTFDERQERARGQAYKYGFWTLLTCLLLYGFSDMVLGRWCDVITGVMLCVAVAMVVFASVCIVKDAYLGLKEKPRTVRTLLAELSAGQAGGRGMKNLRLKSARAALDMSQQQLADAVGVSRQTINAIEKGDYNPTIKLCIAICKTLDKTLDELFWE